MKQLGRNGVKQLGRNGVKQLGRNGVKQLGRNVKQLGLGYGEVGHALRPRPLRQVRIPWGMARLSIRKHDHFTPTKDITRHA